MFRKLLPRPSTEPPAGEGRVEPLAATMAATMVVGEEGGAGPEPTDDALAGRLEDVTAEGG
jgi:hypothetical protein